MSVCLWYLVDVFVIVNVMGSDCLILCVKFGFDSMLLFCCLGSLVVII